MKKYYTRACNFYYGDESIKKVKNKTSIPLNNNKFISFDTLEIITRDNKRKIHIKDINLEKKELKNKIKIDLNLIKKNKSFKKLDFKVSNESAWEVGLACGGEISIFLEQIN